MNVVALCIFLSVCAVCLTVMVCCYTCNCMRKEDAIEGELLETVEADSWKLPLCPCCKKDFEAPMEVDTLSQCPYCEALLYPLVYGE